MDSPFPEPDAQAAPGPSLTFPIVPNSNDPTSSAAQDISPAFPDVPIYDVPTPLAEEKYPVPGQPIDPFSVPPLFFYNHAKKEPKTVTETVSVTKTVFQISFATESQFLTLTDTVYVNKTVFNYVTLTHTNHVTHTKNNTIPMTVFATITAAETSPTLAQATSKPDVSAQQEGGHLKPVAITFIILGTLAGLVVIAGLAWFALRKYRSWKAKENQRMRGVELQRAWEREQDVRREMGEV